MCIRDRIQIVEENGKLIWKCPKCGNTDQDKMNVARRTCGYIGTQFWNQEMCIRDRSYGYARKKARLTGPDRIHPDC